jgi:prevent-host-death family protein
MRHVSSAEARQHLHKVVKEIELTDERVILTRHGKPRAALISAAELEWFERLERESRNRSAGPLPPIAQPPTEEPG